MIEKYATMTPEQIAATLSPRMIGVLGTGHASTHSACVLGSTNTIVALIDRGLVRAGRYHQWTRRGFEVARLVLSGKTYTINELHAEALREDTIRYPYSGNDGDVKHSYRARSCCGSTHGDVHSRACGTIEARKQWAPAGSAHGPVDRRVQRIDPWQVGQHVSVEAAFSEPGDVWKIRELVERSGSQPYAAIELVFRVGGLPIGTTGSAVGLKWLRLPGPPAGTTFRSTTITQAEYERAYDALLEKRTAHSALRSALRVLGMTVKS